MHVATEEQMQAGVVEPDEYDKKTIIDLLTFDSIPTYKEINYRADQLANIAANQCDYEGNYVYFSSAMIGGAPYLMSALEYALDEITVNALYAFSVRESVESVEPDGSVVKRNVFRHLGFVEA
jgi:hypothetical protein